MLISVIIPSYNSEKTIQKTILSVKNQQGLEKYPEIIVVDDGSKDGTLKLLNKIDGITVITQKNSGPATARNNGAKIANGDILAFTDSDTVPRKDWLKNLTAPFESKDIVATTGTYSIENKKSKLAQLIQSEIEYKHSKYKDFIAFGGTYNLAIRKDLFEQIGGFNEDYKKASGEDVDICYKILNKGYKIRFVKEAVVGHFHPENLYKYLKTQLNHGFWRVKLYFDHPNKVTGDDYTGFREIIETLLAGFSIISPFIFVCPKPPFFKGGCLPKADKGIFKCLSILPIISLLFIEYSFVSILYSNRFKSNNILPSKLISAIIISLRAIFRTFGFIKGLILFMPNTINRSKS